MPTYTKVPSDVLDLVREVTEKYHADLAEADVTVGVLMATARINDKTGEPTGPAVTLHGYPCKATIKVNSTRDRVEGKPDATLTLCAANWEESTDEQRRALIDHELTHLVLLREEDGTVKQDDAGRPRMKCRLHDIQYGAFLEVIDRHGLNAPEGQGYADLHRVMTQTKFPWG